MRATPSVPLECCPGCGVELAAAPTGTHPYIGASSGCWALFAALNNGGELHLAPHPLLPLIIDAYCAQHPGVPGARQIQSVAVHLLALHGVLARGMPVERAQWIRERGVRGSAEERHGRFGWLTPPELSSAGSIAAIVAQPDTEQRTACATAWIAAVHACWAALHGPVLDEWYARVIEGTAPTTPLRSDS
jgi:hypothetical protein